MKLGVWCVALDGGVCILDLVWWCWEMHGVGVGAAAADVWLLICATVLVRCFIHMGRPGAAWQHCMPAPASITLMMCDGTV